MTEPVCGEAKYSEDFAVDIEKSSHAFAERREASRPLHPEHSQADRSVSIPLYPGLCAPFAINLSIQWSFRDQSVAPAHQQ